MIISSDPTTNWHNNAIQFPRLIAETMAVGGFTPQVINHLCEEMDLSAADVYALIDRAQAEWDHIKDNTR